MKLSNYSKEYISFLSRHYSNPKRPLLPKTLHQWAYQSLSRAYQMASSHPYEVSVRSSIPKPSMYKSSSLSSQIRTHIESQLHSEVVYSFSLQERYIHIHWVLSERHPRPTAELEKRVRCIMMWCFLLHSFSPRECVRKLDVYLYMTTLQKQLPLSRNEVLSEIHVNTAFTTSCPKDAEIILYRKEEWFKVLIHETFHTFGLDFSGADCQHVHRCIASLFPVKSNINAYEAYTECWAEIWNCWFCSFWETHGFPGFLSKSQMYLLAERRHSFLQLVKVLHFMGLQYRDLTKKPSSYREKTNVFAYYVLKTILLSSPSSFVQWCKTHNGHTFVAFHCTHRNMVEFCHYLREHADSRSMLEGVREAERLWSSLSSVNHHASRTLRMTACELG